MLSIVGRGRLIGRSGVVRSGFVGGGRVVRGRLVGRGRVVLGVGGLSVVGDLGVVSTVVVSRVLDVLGTAVGQNHRVIALHVVTVALLVAGEVGAGVVVVDGVVEGERPGLLLVLDVRGVGSRLVGRSRVVRSRRIGGGHGQNGGNDEHLGKVLFSLTGLLRNIFIFFMLAIKDQCKPLISQSVSKVFYLGKSSAI